MGLSVYEQISFDEKKHSIETRIKNMMWTVSGDYELTTAINFEKYDRAKYMTMYDAAKFGAFAKYFSKEEVSLYLAKKSYLFADEEILMTITQLCIDFASFYKVSKERAGFQALRYKAYDEMSDIVLSQKHMNFIRRVKLGLCRVVLSGQYSGEKAVKEVVDSIVALENCEDTFDIIKTIDHVYNTYFDLEFEKKHGDLAQVLSVTLEELRNSEWADMVKEEANEVTLEDYVESLSNKMTNLDEVKEDKEERTQRAQIIKVNDEDTKKMHSYVELNYGKTYLNETERLKLNRQACKGIHSECSLHFTEGILHSTAKINYQYKYIQRQAEKNTMAYYDNHRMVKSNVSILADILKKSLIIRNEPDFKYADNGLIQPRLLWKVEHTNDRKLFKKIYNSDSTDFVVDILIDSSGSQSRRQAKVAMQGYIISEALSLVNIPHRVMSFCSFWDHTILQRFRDYDDPRHKNFRIFEFYASSYNRDGLAIRGVYEDLIKREEDNKILIILSDGKPNDMTLKRNNGRQPISYQGRTAINDTAFEVRRLRKAGIAVLGVFAGNENELAAEKLIFGKDFAYIRNIKNFSNVVGVYLKKQIGE